MYPEALFARSGDFWALKEFNGAVGICIAINAFYAMLALFYIAMLYRTLRSHDQKKELHNSRYVLAGLLLLFITAAAGGWLKASVNTEMPVLEIGNLIGALVIMRGVIGPLRGFGVRKTQGE
jgi:hypothetical protein